MLLVASRAALPLANTRKHNPKLDFISTSKIRDYISVASFDEYLGRRRETEEKPQEGVKGWGQREEEGRGRTGRKA